MRVGVVEIGLVRAITSTRAKWRKEFVRKPIVRHTEASGSVTFDDLNYHLTLRLN